MGKKIKSWQGWLLFIGTMAIVFVLGLLVASIMERRAEVATSLIIKKLKSRGLNREAGFLVKIIHANTKLCMLPGIPLLKPFNGTKRLMCLKIGPKWLFYGPDTHLPKITSRPRHFYAVKDVYLRCAPGPH
jgi:nitrite reductase (cytochrome c-552)